MTMFQAQEEDAAFEPYKPQEYSSVINAHNFVANLVTSAYYQQNVFMSQEGCDVSEMPNCFSAVFSAVDSQLEQQVSLENPAFMLRIFMDRNYITLFRTVLSYGEFQETSYEERVNTQMVALYEDTYESLLAIDLAHSIAKTMGESLHPEKKKLLYSLSMSLSPPTSPRAVPEQPSVVTPVVLRPPEPELQGVSMTAPIAMSQESAENPTNVSGELYFNHPQTCPPSIQKVIQVLNIEDAENAVVLCTDQGAKVVCVGGPGHDVSTIKPGTTVALNQKNEIMYFYGGDILN